MLERAIDDGPRAGARGAHRARRLRPRLRVDLPVGHARSRSRRSPPGSGPADHHIPSMNWYHRGEERYVEYGSSFPATRAFGIFRSLYDTVYNMNLAHLSRGDADGVRAPRRRRPAHRLHDLPDLPRPPPPRARRATRAYRRLAEARAVPPRRLGRRASSSTPTSSTRAAPAAARRSACPASATATPAASARTWWRTTSSTSCCSRCPTTTPTRTGCGPYGAGHVDRRGRPRARAHDARRRAASTRSSRTTR